MNTMLELSKDADYDIIAASAIIAFAVLVKFWPVVERYIDKAIHFANQRLRS